MVAVIEDRRQEVAELCLRHCVNRLELFGSAAEGQFDPASSDLDFLVEFLPLSPARHADAYFGLLEALQDLFGRDVDLVEVRAVHNPYVLDSINRSRTVIYAA